MHPTIKLINLLILAITINIVSDLALYFIAIVLVVALLIYRVSGVLKSLYRLRWLLLSVSLIYAFTTAGEYIQQWPFAVSPTYEGLQQAGMQMFRLCLMVAGLTLFTATSDRQQIMSGFYSLVSPIKICGLLPERFAARLWLTLHYVEHRQQDAIKNSIFQNLKSTLLQQRVAEEMPVSIDIRLSSLQWYDVWSPTVLVVTMYAVETWLE